MILKVLSNLSGSIIQNFSTDMLGEEGPKRCLIEKDQDVLVEPAVFSGGQRDKQHSGF